MKQELLTELKMRNERIIGAILQKAKIVCPNSIALIGITGSFYSGDIHERSDLDLCIVTNDADGSKIANCFILDEIGHDIYCTPWESLEAVAEYTTPHVTKLLKLDIVYCADDSYRARYMGLREKVQNRLNAPFSTEDAHNVAVHLERAINAYAIVMLSDTVAECKYASVRMLQSIEYMIYLANKCYIRRGVRRIPEDIQKMKRLPEEFLADHKQLIAAHSRDEIQSCSTRLMKTTRTFVTILNERVAVKKEITAQSLRGTYEEIVSNWKNKMHFAACTNDTYLACMTLASCQEFYDDLATDYPIERVELFEAFHTDHLFQSVEHFNAAMAQYERLYTEVGEPIRDYTSLAAFEQAYLEHE